MFFKKRFNIYMCKHYKFSKLIKRAIKKTTEITGFLEVITKTLEIIEPKANKSINKLEFVIFYKKN